MVLEQSNPLYGWSNRLLMAALGGKTVRTHVIRAGITAVIVTGLSLSGVVFPQLYGILQVHAASPGDYCHHTVVVLHGGNAPAISCADQTPGTVRPDTGQTGCSSSTALHVYGGQSGSGDSICFTGNGYTDLTAIPFGFCCGQNWGNRIRSYTANSQAGRFYDQTGETGNHWIFNPDPTTYNFNAQFDQKAQSICIAATSSNCP